MIKMQSQRKWETLKEQLTSTPYLILTNAWVTLLAGSFHWPALVDSLRTERRKQLTVLAQNWQFQNSKHEKKNALARRQSRNHIKTNHLWDYLWSRVEVPFKAHVTIIMNKNGLSRTEWWFGGRGDRRTWVLQTAFTITFTVHFPQKQRTVSSLE